MVWLFRWLDASTIQLAGVAVLFVPIDIDTDDAYEDLAL